MTSTVAAGVHRVTDGLVNLYLIESEGRVSTPGHTEGHVSYHFPSLGVLVSGDALVTMDPRTRQRGPRVATPVLCSDYAQAVQSLDALEPLSGDVILPGHGDPFYGPIADAVAQAREAALR